MMVKIRATLAALTVTLTCVSFSLGEVAKQAAGTDYLVVEAETFINDEDLNDEFTGFTILSSEPAEYDLEGGGLIELPQPWFDASGGQAILDQAGGGDFADKIYWETEFAEAGTYYLYFRYSLFDMRGLIDNTYGNEDSFYIPFNSFDEDPAGDSDEIRTDRIGFSALSSMGATPENGCRDIEADPFDNESLYLPIEDCEGDGLRTELHWEGQYHWAPARFNFTGENAQYDIEDTGVVLDYQIASRERGSSLDVMVFSMDPNLTAEDLDALVGIGVVDPGVAGDFNNSGARDVGDLDLLAAAMASGDVSFDLTGDGAVNFDDRAFWVESLANTFIGDANFDGQFNSSDFVAVFGAAKYETNAPATWAEGDWNGDGVFSSGDFVAAFGGAGYEKGPRDGGLQVVPEPTSSLLIISGLLAFALRRRA
ncbi:MAG: PEP-CTERM sorting domain-containing protein [Planctomycetales bacterium]|nr:PEP-CTERM sorting domain-containing protein [Planctomycetales bacterium]